jgi:hypothetical protein
LSAGPIIEATLIEESEPKETHHLKGLLQSRNCQIILTLTVALFVGVVVAVVLLTQNGSKTGTSNATLAPETDTNETTSDKFLANLKALLSNELQTALDEPGSPQSLSLAWLLERSNFQAWSFDRQVQRYVVATIYYATGGRSWSNQLKWLTNVTECRWFQGSEGDFCGENGTALQSLNQSKNALIGKIPDEIGLLTSLTVIDLALNQISGTLLTQLGSLTALTHLDLSSNRFTGTVPSEVGSLAALTALSLYDNGLIGNVPSELGSLTALTHLSLSGNTFTGTVPSELGSLTRLRYLYTCIPILSQALCHRNLVP